MVISRTARTAGCCVVLLVSVAAAALTLLLGIVSSNDGRIALLFARTQPHFIYDWLLQTSPEVFTSMVVHPVAGVYRNGVSQLLRFALGSDPGEVFRTLIPLAKKTGELVDLGNREYAVLSYYSNVAIVAQARKGVVRPSMSSATFVSNLDPLSGRSQQSREAMDTLLARILSVQINSAGRSAKAAFVRSDGSVVGNSTEPSDTFSPYAASDAAHESQRSSFYSRKARTQFTSNAPWYASFPLIPCDQGPSPSPASSEHRASARRGGESVYSRDKAWVQLSREITRLSFQFATGLLASDHQLDTMLQFQGVVPYSGLQGTFLPPLSRLRPSIEEAAQEARSTATRLVLDGLGQTITHVLEEVNLAAKPTKHKPTNSAASRERQYQQRQEDGDGNGNSGSHGVEQMQARVLASMGLNEAKVATVLGDQLLRAATVVGASAGMHTLESIWEWSEARHAATEQDIVIDDSLLRDLVVLALRERPVVAARQWEVVRDISGDSVGLNPTLRLRAGDVLIAAVASANMNTSLLVACDAKSPDGLREMSSDCHDALGNVSTVHGALGGARSLPPAELYQYKVGLQSAACALKSLVPMKLREQAASSTESASELGASSSSGQMGAVDVGFLRTKVAFFAWLLTVLSMCGYLMNASLRHGDVTSFVAGLRTLVMRRPVVRWYGMYLMAQAVLAAGFVLDLPVLQHVSMAVAGSAYLLLAAEIDCLVMEGGEQQVTYGRKVPAAVRADFVRRGSHSLGQLTLRRSSVILSCLSVIVMQLLADCMATDGSIYAWSMDAAAAWYTPCAAAGMYALVAFAMRPAESDGALSVAERARVPASVHIYGSRLERDLTEVGDVPKGDERVTEWLGVVAGLMGIANLFWPRLLLGAGAFHLASRVSDCLFYVPLILPVVLKMDRRCAMAADPSIKRGDHSLLRLLRGEVCLLLGIAFAVGLYAVHLQVWL